MCEGQCRTFRQERTLGQKNNIISEGNFRDSDSLTLVCGGKVNVRKRSRL